MKRSIVGLGAVLIGIAATAVPAVAAPVVPLVRAGEPAPGGGGAVFEHFYGAADVNNSGQVAFCAELDDGRQGIWRDHGVIALGGLPLPDGLTAYDYAAEPSPSINNAGVVAFLGYPLGGS